PAWRVKLRLAPRSTYTLIADEALRDIHGRALVGPRSVKLVTHDYRPAIGFALGSVTIPRSGPRTLPLRHVNVRTARIISYTFPEPARARVLAAAPFRLDTSLLSLGGRPETTLVALAAPFNVERTTELPLPARLTAAGTGVAVLAIEAVQDIPSPEAEAAARSGGLKPIVVRAPYPGRSGPRLVIVQLTDLAVHAKAGPEGGAVLVTGLADGRPRAGVAVRQLDAEGNTLARGSTGPDGVAELRYVVDPRTAAPPRDGPIPSRTQSGAVLIEAVADGDRVVTPLMIRAIGYPPWGPLEPARLGGRSQMPRTIAATLFTDRGIYRPGEMLYVTGVLRQGTLSTLKVPTRGDSARLTVRYQPTGGESDEDVVVRDTVLHMTEFGTVTDSSRLRTGLPLGGYVAELSYDGSTVAREELRVAEYRAPEFLVDARTDSTPRYGGDTVRVDVTGRYLFGAPMGRAEVRWGAVIHEVQPWELRIPRADGWTVGEWDWWRGDDGRATYPRQIGGTDSLDASGRAEIRVPLDSLSASRPGRVEIAIAITDINRQSVTASASVPVHPARLYVLARRQSRGWYWTVGQPATVEIRTARPDGRDLSGVPVVVSLVRREWRWDAGRAWKDSVVRTDTVRTGMRPVPFSFVPTAGGIYELRLVASDGRGGVARTTLSGYAIARGSGWWAENPYQLPLVAERKALAVGDSTSVLFDSPFDVAEAWITLEREGILEGRRMVVRRGPNVVPIRVTDAHVPNVFVSVLLVRRTEAAHAPRPDSASQLVRAGYVELQVKADRKRLTVVAEPVARERGPGDTAAIRVHVSDAAGRGVSSEVTVWAVDEGVLALSGFETPDLVSRLYEPRGLGSRLVSTLPSILTANPSLFLALDQSVVLGMSASRLSLSTAVVTGVSTAPGALSIPLSASLRKRFRSTAFYLAAARTDASGLAELRAKLPDNLTTYRVMAVAVGADDRFGSGDTTLLVTRPLVARPTLPRFVRASDTLRAGAVVNVRDGDVTRVAVEAGADGIALDGPTRREIVLAAGKGAEARFGFTVPPRDRAPDTVVVRLRASDGVRGDAVETRLPVQPDFHSRAHTEIGAVRGSAEVTMELPGETDPARSRLTVRIGTTPLAPMLAAYDWLRVYPYDCTEQIASGGRALLAVWRATRGRDTKALGGDPRPHLQELADELARRQRADGAIRYWDDHDWSSPWLTTYAGLFLLEARDQGITVDSAVLRRVARYLSGAAEAPIDTGGMNRYERRARRLALGGRVATVEFLRRFGDPDVKAEDRLLALAP
ncbi:MAG TPA: alpha-2-macroglobulin family protein, partial [Gemmatimonadaceae bacterium]|nr:alpha-2-macroglobulin family protein [Gemmatimonadaceae bacterium]